MADITFETGVKEINVNGVRTIKVNPADIGFLETIYSLLGKVEAINEDKSKHNDKDDLAKLFDRYRNNDKKTRDAVDAVFGVGFCDDVFSGVRLSAVTSTGLTALENFVFAVIDEMDDSIKERTAKRNDTIAKYTSKYEKYHKK